MKENLQDADSVAADLSDIANELDQMSDVLNNKWPSDVANRLRFVIARIDGIGLATQE